MSISHQSRLLTFAQRVLPGSLYAKVLDHRRVRKVAARQPVSRCFGLDRGGKPIDRYYIERFLAQHADDVRGAVLEIGDATYTRQFGGDRVTRSEVLRVDSGNPHATVVGDLASGAGVTPGAFDCFICTQTLMFIYDVRAAVANIHRALKPGGVALATLAGICQIARYDMDHWGDYWRFTSKAAQRLFADVFGENQIEVGASGNSFAAVCLLQGLTVEELRPEELDAQDRDYEIVITVRARKPATA